jgi:coronin-1B/1C/6
MHENEVVRAFKTVNDSYIEPISFIVPRRAEVFQGDIYPPTAGLKPAMSSGEWFGGKDGLPPKIDMFSLYVGEGLKEVPKETPPVVEKAHDATQAESVKEPEAKPLRSSSAALPSSVKEQSASMAAIASKYADDDDDKKEDVDDSSSFGVSEPTELTERPAAITLSPVEIEPPAISPPGLWKAKKTASKPTDTRTDQVAFASFQPSELPSCLILSTLLTFLSFQTVESLANLTSSIPAAGVAAADESSFAPQYSIKRDLESIRALIAEQTRTIAAQSEQIQVLTTEIDSLRKKLS